MKNFTKFAKTLLCLSLAALLVCSAAASGIAAPVWDKYLPEGGQFDDTGIDEISRWLNIPGNREMILSEIGSNQIPASLIVENARSLVGKYPYVYGGESPEEGGFDCTGLVWYVYHVMSGVDITLAQAGRSKSALAAAGEKITNVEDFLPGDVVQFTYAHVAIYVGDGRVVHARKTGTYVQETDLNVSYVDYAIRYPGITQNSVMGSGMCGDDVSWEVCEDGTLTISGTGAMEDYTCATGDMGELISTAPWGDLSASITTLVVEDGVTDIGTYAFYGCAALESVQLAESVCTIGDWAFAACGALAEIALPAAVDTIADSVFYDCAALERISFSDELTRIGYAAFYNCAALEQLSLPETLQEIGECAFWGCVRLGSMEIPEGITRIGDYTFCDCAALERISLPKSLTSVGDWAFLGCAALGTVSYAGSPGGWKSVAVGAGNDDLLRAQFECSIPFDAPAVTAGNIAATGKIKLSWDAIDGAEKYEVWRATSKNGTYTRITTTAKTSITNTKTEPGTTYYYKVRAVAGDAKGEFSKIVSRTCDLPQPIVKAANVASSGKIKLTWDKVDGAVKYEVWRATSKNGTYTKITTTAKTSVTNTKTEPAVTYYYKVKAIAEKSAANSALSDIVSRTCDLAQPIVTLTLSSKGKIVLTWDAIDGATGYEIWRATEEGGTFTKIWTGTSTKITNTKVTDGVNYYYKVRAICEKKAATGAFSAVQAMTAGKTTEEP